MTDKELMEMVKRTQDVIYWYTGHNWFAKKTASVLLEIGAITAEEYERVCGMLGEV